MHETQAESVEVKREKNEMAGSELGWSIVFFPMQPMLP